MNRIRTKLTENISIKLIFVSVTFLSIGSYAGHREGYTKANNLSKKLNTLSEIDSKIKPSPKKNIADSYELKSPFDPADKLKLTIVNNDEYKWVIFLHDGDEKTKIGSFFNTVHNFKWTRDSSKVSFTNHRVSNSDVVYIIDINSKIAYPVEGEQELFVSSQSEDSSLYSHVYSYNIGWHDNNTLIISTSGYPDGIDFRPKDQLFLINGNTGKVIKRVL